MYGKVKDKGSLLIDMVVTKYECHNIDGRQCHCLTATLDANSYM